MSPESSHCLMTHKTLKLGKYSIHITRDIEITVKGLEKIHTRLFVIFSKSSV